MPFNLADLGGLLFLVSLLLFFFGPRRIKLGETISQEQKQRHKRGRIMMVAAGLFLLSLMFIGAGNASTY